MKAFLHKGESFTDNRGRLEFVNEENPGHYRRFYLMNHADTKIVRAWQGHKIEEKGFYVIKGSFIIAVVNPENFEHPNDEEKPEIFRLDLEGKLFLRVPGGNYTGIKALEPDSTLLVLSGMDFAGSKKDDYRQPTNRWVEWDSII
jgi:WxcM-like, C-terminal